MNNELADIINIAVVILLVYIYNHDKVEKEPRGLLFLAFLSGCISTVLAFVVQLPLLSCSETIADPNARIAFLSFGMAAFTEEVRFIRRFGGVNGIY